MFPPSVKHITLLGVSQIIAYGTLFYAFPQIAERMIAEFGWSKSETYGALTAVFIASAITALPIGKAMDRGYGKSVMGWGSVIAGLLLIAWSQVNSLFELYLAMVGLGAVHSATLYKATFSLINHDDLIRDKQDAITSVTLWGGFASTVFIPLIELMLAHTSWNNTLIVMGLMNILLCPLVYSFIPVNCRPVADSVDVPEKQQHNTMWALGQPTFWLLLLSFSTHAAIIAAFTFHLYPILLEREFLAGQVAMILAFVGPAQVGGRIVLKLLKDRGPSSGMIFWAALVFPFAYFLIQYLPADLAAFSAVIVLYGSANGIMTILRAMAVPHFLTKNAYGEINGAMSIPVTLAQSVSPAVAAMIWQTTQDYATVVDLMILLSLGVAALFGLVVLKQKIQGSKI